MDSPKIKGNNIERITIEIDSAKKQQPKFSKLYYCIHYLEVALVIWN